MFLRSMMLGSTRYFAAPDKPGAAGGEGTGDQGTGGEGTGDQGAAGDAGGSNTGTQDREPAAGDAGGEGEGTSAEGGEPEPAPAAGASAAEKKDWRDREIARKHRQLKDSQREQDRLRR